MIARHAYRWATHALKPAAHLLLARRAARGKEDRARLGERWGRAIQPRPAGVLIWLHGASIGESVSLLPLIDRLLAIRPDIEVLITTGTVTSARLLAGRLPVLRARHQFLPLDHPAAVKRFLDHWRPDLAIWVESELWPNLILDTHQRGIPMALINARMSDRSFKGWQRWPGLIRPVLASFALVLGQDVHQAERLRQLGADAAESVGDLKAAGTALPAEPAQVEGLSAAIAGRPVWLAASTHPGEEAAVAAADRALRAQFPHLLTLIAPRHPVRGDAVEAILRAQGIVTARRSRGEIIDPATETYLIDTMGELGLFYRLAPIVLVAGSLGTPGMIGGHNPIEAAQLGCAVVMGPDNANCAASLAALQAAGAALVLDEPDGLAGVLAELLADPARTERMGEAGRAVAALNRGVLDLVLARVMPLIPPLAEPERDPARA